MVDQRGSRLVTRRDDGTVTIWDVDRGTAIPHAPLRQVTRQSTDDVSFDELPGVAMHDDRIAIIADSGLVVIDAKTGARVREFHAAPEHVDLGFD